MQVFGTGDLATNLLMRQHNARLSAQLSKAGLELASGQISDISSALKGAVGPLASIERSIAMLGSYSVAISTAELKLTYQQTALNTIAAEHTKFGADLISAAEGGAAGLEPAIRASENSFHIALAALSANVGGAYVFGGEVSNVAPLRQADDILSELQTLVAGATTATDFWQRVDEWFAVPSGFEAFAYQGGNAQNSGVRIGDGEVFTVETTAISGEVKQSLRDFAISSLMNAGHFSGSDEEFAELARLVGASSIASNDALIGRRADIGAHQQHLEQSAIRNAAEKSALSEARNNLVSVDPFDAASKLEEIQFNLESLYVVTAKLSRLTLTEYLR